MRGLAVRLFGLVWADRGANELRLDLVIVVEPEDVWVIGGRGRRHPPGSLMDGIVDELPGARRSGRSSAGTPRSPCRKHQ